MMKNSLVILSLLLLVITQTTQAVEKTDSADSLCLIPAEAILAKDSFSKDGKMHLQADKVSLDKKDSSSFSGNVVIQQPETRIESERAIYNKQTQQVDAIGKVNFLSPTLQVKSESARINLTTEQALLKNSEYQSLISRARGKASQINVNNDGLVQLKDATYTTCPVGNTDWLFSASELTLDKNNSQGSATNVVLRFKGVPFFYFPYLQFPLGEQRMSGFLFPTLGLSDQHGSEFKIPYYWNIHPQLDATITPWSMSKRGTMLQSEFRYLTENNQGTISNEYLKNDKLFNDKRTRWHWLHNSTPGPGWRVNTEYNYVADNNHLTDFTNDLNSTSTTHLIRTGTLTYDNPDWLLNIKAEDYQTLSGTEPYKRLPQISINSRFPPKDNALNYELQSEYVRFDHIDNQVIGERLHIKPSVSWPMRYAAGFVTPKIALQYTSYNLKQTSKELKPTRTIPTFSLDSGLYFERDTSLFKQNYIQTLEPQLFYVYVPYQDQSNLPVFDTSAYTFNFNQPFADTRFNGIDRIGDDNRLTAALTTRFLKQDNGNEVFLARVGQVYYFKDREVQLSGSIDTSAVSHIIAELKAQPGNWSLSSQLEWDPISKTTEVSSSQLGYRHKDIFNFSLAHRFQLNNLETREFNMNWKINTRWNINTSHLYDIKQSHIVENMFGINYESCCWGLQFSTKERFLSTTQTDHGIYIELILKGLGGFGIKQ